MSLPTPPVASPPFAAIPNGAGISLIYQSPSDQTLWIVTSSSAPTGKNTDWSPPQQLQQGINVGSSPAAAGVGNTAWILYQGSGGTNLWIANSPNWSSFQIPTFGTTTSMTPGLTQVNGALYAFFMSSGNLCMTQAYTLVPPPSDPTQAPINWQLPSPLSVNGSSATSSFTPAVAAQGGQLCIVYGTASSLTSMQASIGATWTSTTLPFTTTCSPSLVNVAGTFYLAYLGSGSTIGLTASGDGQSWQSQPISLPSNMTTNFSPVAVVLGNNLYIFYASSLNDGTIWYTWDTPNAPLGNWQGPNQLVYLASPQATTTTAVTFGMQS
jgi:hypothetical protein